MSDETLSQRLQKIINSLNQVRKSLNTSNLEPANLNWETCLTTMPVVGKQIQLILREITPVLKYYVVFPTSPDGPKDLNALDIFCAKDISELDSENQACKEDYQKAIHEFNFESYQPEERKEFIERLIADHNVICKGLDDFAASLIKEKQLKKTQNISQTISTQPQAPPFDLLNALNDGTFKGNSEALPVHPR